MTKRKRKPLPPAKRAELLSKLLKTVRAKNRKFSDSLAVAQDRIRELERIVKLDRLKINGLIQQLERGPWADIKRLRDELRAEIRDLEQPGGFTGNRPNGVG